MGLRTNTAVWLPNQNRWQIKVQKDGVRRTFTSTKPGRTGQREANRKADVWLDEGISSTTKRCADVWAEYMISVKATGGTSNIEQVEKFGRNYILPVIGQRRIGDLTTGMLQDVLNRSYKAGCLNPDSKRKSRGNLSRKTLQGIRGVEVAFVKWARQHKYTALAPGGRGPDRAEGCPPERPEDLAAGQSAGAFIHRHPRGAWKSGAGRERARLPHRGHDRLAPW